MSLLAHTGHDDGTILSRLLHPFTGIDHLAAIALVALSGVLLMAALRGRHAAATDGHTTRVRSIALLGCAAVAFVASVALLVLV